MEETEVSVVRAAMAAMRVMAKKERRVPSTAKTGLDRAETVARRGWVAKEVPLEMAVTEAQSFL
ncbi:hypothetical protein EAS54_08160 [Bradyrhizobium guangzhouense]|nr:hypothetical protein EAS54_08160 [Bradyrhizobium guangzhouense]